MPAALLFGGGHRVTRCAFGVTCRVSLRYPCEIAFAWEVFSGLGSSLYRDSASLPPSNSAVAVLLAKAC